MTADQVAQETITAERLAAGCALCGEPFHELFPQVYTHKERPGVIVCAECKPLLDLIADVVPTYEREDAAWHRRLARACTIAGLTLVAVALAATLVARR